MIPVGIDLRSGYVKDDRPPGPVSGVLHAVLGVQFEQRGDTWWAEASDLPVPAGFVHHQNFEMRRSLTPREARAAFEAFQEAEFDVAQWVEAHQASGP